MSDLSGSCAESNEAEQIPVGLAELLDTSEDIRALAAQASHAADHSYGPTDVAPVILALEALTHAMLLVAETNYMHGYPRVTDGGS